MSHTARNNEQPNCCLGAGRTNRLTLMFRVWRPEILLLLTRVALTAPKGAYCRRCDGPGRLTRWTTFGGKCPRLRNFLADDKSRGCLQPRIGSTDRRKPSDGRGSVLCWFAGKFCEFIMARVTGDHRCTCADEEPPRSIYHRDNMPFSGLTAPAVRYCLRFAEHRVRQKVTP